jgi:hypothetical protein
MISVTIPLSGPREFDELPEGPKLIAELCQRGDPGGEEGPCTLCGGTGFLPRYKDPCLRCRGAGKVRAAYFVRINFEADEEKRLAVVEALTWALALGKKTKALVRLVEEGGSGRDEGKATVICGLRGEKMQPQRGWASPNGEHAVFWLSRGLRVTYAFDSLVDGAGTVDIVEVDPNLNLRVTWAWSFFRRTPEGTGSVVQTLPNIHLRFPEEAVRAVIRKARTPNCREPSFVDSRELQESRR